MKINSTSESCRNKTLVCKISLIVLTSKHLYVSFQYYFLSEFFYCIFIAILKLVQSKTKQILLSKPHTVIKKRQNEGLVSILLEVFKKCYAFNEIQKASNILVQIFHPPHSSACSTLAWISAYTNRMSSKMYMCI